jgi:large subunit ribosomal protein LP0
MPTRERKEYHAARLVQYLNTYKKCFIVGVDNVGSKQMAEIRASLRDGNGNKDACAVVCLGKNTLIRRTLGLHPDERVRALSKYVVMNMGFVFTNGDLPAVRDILKANTVGAPAKTGAICEKLIIAPAGPSGQPPDKTAFFQALNIPTKINRGQIEITADFEVCQPGEKVGASQAALLQMLDIKPFVYGLKILKIYDSGEMFSPAVLDINDAMLTGMFSDACRNVAAMSFALETPNMCTAPHQVIRGFQDLVSIAMACENYSFPLADKMIAMC